uniref:Tf2-1-like SH3-like domain-containing protein n=1 Tax=Lygus hesperus TaxID=30085 RepID=A0A146L5E6_LYGHE
MKSPHFCVFGMNARKTDGLQDNNAPTTNEARIELIRETQDNILPRIHETEFAKTKKAHDKNRTQNMYEPGDLVLIRNDCFNQTKNKWTQKYLGPFEVIDRTGENNYRIQTYQPTKENVQKERIRGNE